MHLELPVCKRCCFCLPLRQGLIAWGYFRLFVTGLVLAGLIINWRSIFEVDNGNAISIVIGCIITFLVILDTILGITFIVGCHKKSVKILKLFYFYGQFLFVLITVWSIFYIINHVTSTLRDGGEVIWLYRLMDCAVSFTQIVVQIYILLLVRSEIIKINDGCQFRFANSNDEAKCILDIDKTKEDKVEKC